MLSKLLTSKTRAELFRLLFDGQSSEHYLRGLEKLTDLKVNSLQKEVKHLVSMDLLNSRKDGNRVYYSANTLHPLYSDLVSIVEKTVGLIAILKNRLDVDQIELAFVFGSLASGKEKASSDVDIIVVGDLGMRKLSKLLSGLQESLGREINPHIFSREEFLKKIKRKDHFLTSVMKSDIKEIVGRIDDYK